ncbi:hypothetical protein EIP91_002980 [Steccherinum ochraceum]|uniref:BTB domain-containing protein n=1 Tax=Steccherinum ochraceum TaxID=92696 RepID=A0A4R0RHG5_9APHY|nr:hypothetical protein EIP91_002980 [Steccherinum ochraceum]
MSDEYPGEGSRKRARIDDTADAKVAYTRGELWYDDGNIILFAEDGTGFRVYKGVLSRYSEVFRDMFSIPQPADAELWDGCPVVHLSDSSKSLHRVLCVLFTNDDVLGFKQGLPFETVAAMLQLGSKYHMQHLRRDAIQRLSSYFTTELHEFINDFVVSTPDDEQPPPNFPEGAIVGMNGCDALAVISLAQAYDVSCLLPSAFYIVAQLELPDILGGHIDQDGTNWSLSPADIQRCLQGQERLRRRGAKHILYYEDFSPSSECTERKSCKGLFALPRSFDTYAGKPSTTKQLDTLASIMKASFAESRVTKLGSGGRPENEWAFHRACAAGAAAGAFLFAAFLRGTDEVIGCVFFYPPGQGILSDEIQRAQGFDKYLNESLTEEERKAFIQFETDYAKVGAGRAQKDKAWSVNYLCVSEKYRNKGVARALLEKGDALARAQRSKVMFEAATDDTLKMYIHLGYTFIDTDPCEDMAFHVIVKDFTT